MSNEILSQEEIDALLSAMDKGEVDLENQPAETVATEAYDFTSQEIPVKDEFDALNEINDKFLKLAKNTFETRLQTDVTVGPASTDAIKYEDFIKSHPRPTAFGIFSMPPLIGTGLIVIEPKLFFTFIDCMAGGLGHPPTVIHDFTAIEMGAIRRFLADILKDMETAWQSVYAIKIALVKDEINPAFLHVAGATDLMFVIHYDIKINRFSSQMHLCFPYLMLDAIKNELSSTYQQSKNMEHVFADQMKDLLNTTPITITAELGRSLHTVRDILQLKKDDVVTLDKGPQDEVIVSIESIPKYKGIAGISKGNRAVHIIETMQHKGGS